MIESADWEMESAESTADSTTDSPKIGVWVRGLSDRATLMFLKFDM